MATRSAKGNGLAHTAPNIARRLEIDLSAILTAKKCVYAAGPVLSVRAARAVGMEETAQNIVFQSPDAISVTHGEKEFVLAAGMDAHALNTAKREESIISVPRENESACQGGLDHHVTSTARLRRRQGSVTLAVIKTGTKFAARDGTDPNVLTIVYHVMITSTDITLVMSLGIKFAYQDGMGPSALNIEFHKAMTSVGIMCVTSMGIRSVRMGTNFLIVVVLF